MRASSGTSRTGRHARHDGHVRPSWAASLDARTKMTACLAVSLAVIFLKSPEALILLAVLGAIQLLAVRRVGVALACWGLLLAVSAIAFGFTWGIHAIWPQSWIKMDAPDLRQFAIPFLRTFVIFNVVLALALSTRIQAVLSALAAMRLPVWLGLPATVMIRFIPSFVQDVREIRQAMQARGWSAGPSGFLLRPVDSVRLLFMPLVIRALRASDELGVAAELKGVRGGFRPTRLNGANLGYRDWTALTVCVLSVATAFILQLANGQAKSLMH